MPPSFVALAPGEGARRRMHTAGFERVYKFIFRRLAHEK